MAVITISHQLGSGGHIVAQAVAHQLGYRLVGAGMLAEAAQEHELAVERLRRLGRAKPGLLDRLGAGTQLYLAVIQNAVYEAAARNDVVLEGRGGQWLLRGVPHVLRVRVVASVDARVRWLAEHVQTGARREALLDLVRRDDADKAGRMRFLYDRDIDDPQLYDLVTNTERGDLEGAAATIVALARRPAFATTDEGRRLVADRGLAARVLVALLNHEDTRDDRHEAVEARDGRVRIVTTGAPAVVAGVARSVEGVRDVTTEELAVIPPMPM